VRLRVHDDKFCEPISRFRLTSGQRGNDQIHTNFVRPDLHSFDHAWGECRGQVQNIVGLTIPKLSSILYSTTWKKCLVTGMVHVLCQMQGLAQQAVFESILKAECII
jgi:hypothetical protein